MNRFLGIEVLSPLVRHRPTCGAICGLGAVQMGLAMAHLPGWPCPLLHATGIPCPGCGLSRASASLLHGHVGLAMHQHAFAPVLLASLVILAGGAVLPSGLVRRIAAIVGNAERRTGISSLLLLSLVLYWIMRLVYDPGAIPH